MPAPKPAEDRHARRRAIREAAAVEPRYPAELPVAAHRQAILQAIRSSQVVVVQADTGGAFGGKGEDAAMVAAHAALLAAWREQAVAMAAEKTKARITGRREDWTWAIQTAEKMGFAKNLEIVIQRSDKAFLLAQMLRLSATLKLAPAPKLALAVSS